MRLGALGCEGCLEILQGGPCREEAAVSEVGRTTLRRAGNRIWTRENKSSSLLAFFRKSISAPTFLHWALKEKLAAAIGLSPDQDPLGPAKRGLVLRDLIECSDTRLHDYPGRAARSKVALTFLP